RRAFDHHETDDPPPGEAARAEFVRRQRGEIVGEADARAHEITGSRVRCRCFGQNQAVMAIATGTAPTAIAQGEKIDAMNRTATATAAMNGHKLASGIGSRRSGVAATTVVSSTSLSSTRRPVTTGRSPSMSHKGVRLSATGMCAKL